MHMRQFDSEEDEFLSSLTDDEIEKIPELHKKMFKYVIAMKVPILAMAISALFIAAFLGLVMIVLT